MEPWQKPDDASRAIDSLGELERALDDLLRSTGAEPRTEALESFARRLESCGQSLLLLGGVDEDPRVREALQRVSKLHSVVRAPMLEQRDQTGEVLDKVRSVRRNLGYYVAEDGGDSCDVTG